MVLHIEYCNIFKLLRNVIKILQIVNIKKELNNTTKILVRQNKDMLI